MEKILAFKPGIILIQITLLVVASLQLTAQVNLVSQTVRNGSFEDTFLSPWAVGSGNASVTLNSSLSSQGDWHAIISQTALSSIVRSSITQSLSANRFDGFFFTLGFDARNGLASFGGVRLTFAIQNTDSSYALVTNTFLNLSNGGWQSFEKSFVVPSNWDGGGNLFLGFQFERQGAVIGDTYTGYLDNIVLTQIPEPSVAALTGLCLAGIALSQNHHRHSPKHRR